MKNARMKIIILAFSALSLFAKGNPSEIGDIVFSILPPTPEGFFEHRNQSEWKLLDGGSLVGTTLKQQMQYIEQSDNPFQFSSVENLPDARGRFIRMMNHEGGADPQNGRSIGSNQEDATKMPNNKFTIHENGNHTHTLPHGQQEQMWGSGWQRNCWAGGNSYSQTSNSAGNHTHQISGGDSETRPKNITVFIYIKVN